MPKGEKLLGQSKWTAPLEILKQFQLVFPKLVKTILNLRWDIFAKKKTFCQILELSFVKQKHLRNRETFSNLINAYKSFKKSFAKQNSSGWKGGPIC
jgi:hypothetical protein